MYTGCIRSAGLDSRKQIIKKIILSISISRRLISLHNSHFLTFLLDIHFHSKQELPADYPVRCNRCPKFCKKEDKDLIDFYNIKITSDVLSTFVRKVNDWKKFLGRSKALQVDMDIARYSINWHSFGCRRWNEWGFSIVFLFRVGVFIVTENELAGKNTGELDIEISHKVWISCIQCMIHKKSFWSGMEQK